MAADIESSSSFKVLQYVVTVPEQLRKYYQNKLFEHTISMPSNYVQHMIKCNFIEQFIQVIENIAYNENNTTTAAVFKNLPDKVNQKRRYEEMDPLATDTRQQGHPIKKLKRNPITSVTNLFQSQ